MRATHSLFSILSLTTTFLFASPILAQYPQSAKRGLVSVSTNNPKDQQLFVQPNNGLTWYFNYAILPTPEYINLTQADIEFVPTLWGVGNASDTTFLSNVTSMINNGRAVMHVFSFNEPDMNFTQGGSQVSPDTAAASWINNFDPLRKLGVKVGAPVVHENEAGFTWLEKFYAACKTRGSSCTADFMNIHFFGNISALQSYLGEYKQRYPSIPLWISEFALPNSPLPATEEFFNQSIALFDSDSTVERYSYFGSFRSTASGVGKNVTMLNANGNFTNIGNWYLGGAMVPDVTPTSTTSTIAAAKTSAVKNATVAQTTTTTSAKISEATGMSRGGAEMVGSVVIAAVAVIGLL